jgi:hypothetical protein
MRPGWLHGQAGAGDEGHSARRFVWPSSTQTLSFFYHRYKCVRTAPHSRCSCLRSIQDVTCIPRTFSRRKRTATNTAASTACLHCSPHEALMPLYCQQIRLYCEECTRPRGAEEELLGRQLWRGSSLRWKVFFPVGNKALLSKGCTTRPSGRKGWVWLNDWGRNTRIRIQ